MALQDILPLTSNDFSFRWNTEVPLGTPTFVTYSFGDVKAGYDSEIRPAFSVWTEAHKAHVRAALSVWDAASGIKFLEVPDAEIGQIRFSMYDMTGEVVSGGNQVAGFAYYPTIRTSYSDEGSQSEVIPDYLGGDVFLNASFYASDPDSLAPGDGGFRVVLHELGHALGFKHPFEGSPIIAPQYDNDDYTVMTYNGVASTVSLGSLDIEASQYYYGVTDAGYTWDAANLKLTIYGTDSADARIGTELSDTIVGLSGNDLIIGKDGNDTLDGGSGADRMFGGAGDDTYLVDSIDDEVFEQGFSESGVDTVQSSVNFSLDVNPGVRRVENLTLTGTTNINGTGNWQMNVMTGNAGNNTLNGGENNDTLIGGAGNDTYVVDNWLDEVFETTTTISLIDAGGVDTIQSSVNFDLSVYAGVRFVENLTLTGDGIIRGVGNALANMLTGNSGSNTLYGLGGNDTLIGGLGNDFLNGGAGNDIYVVDSIGDRVNESEFVDLIDGGIDTVQSSVSFSLAASTVEGFIERLTLIGMGNIDGTGNALANVMLGNSGNNTLNGWLGNDVMGGGVGNDTYVVDSASDFVFETTTISTLIDAGGVDTILSSVTFNLDAAAGVRFIENLTLTGAANINGTGNALANLLTGNSGNNALNGGLGNDVMGGGAGNDIYVVDSIADQVFETTTISSLIDAGGVDTIQSSVSASLDANAGVRFVERLTLTGSANINGDGNALDNVMIGNAASNTLNGGLGNDLMMGGAGNDFYLVDSIGDRVYETTAVSSLIDAGGVDTIQSSVAMSLDAYAGVRFVERLTLTGTGNINGDGNTLDNVLLGNTGNNTLNGGLGSDTMGGGAGNDIYIVDSIGDRVFEMTTISSGIDAGGVDIIQSSVALSLDAYAGVRFVERLTLTGTGNINGLGNALDNVLLGNSGNNALNGGLGADIMGGGAGNDIYVVDSVNDRVFETITISSLIDAGGVDTIQTSVTTNLDAYAAVRFVENLTLTGTANIDGAGNALANVLTGNSGNNTLNGGLGNDTMFGGLGADTFVFSTTLGASNIDQITGFSVVDDTIRLDDVVFLGLAPNTLAANAFAANLTGEAATDFDRIIYETDTGGLFYDNDGLGGAARVQFATLTTGLALTNADFFVF